MVEVVLGVGGDVAEVAEGVHRLVVAVQREDLAARGFRLGGEALEQIEDLLLAAAAIELVARLHQDQLFAGPMSVSAQGPGQAEDRLGGVKVAVQVTDGDQTGRRWPSKRGRKGSFHCRRNRSGGGQGSARGRGSGGRLRFGLRLGRRLRRAAPTSEKQEGPRPKAQVGSAPHPTRQRAECTKGEAHRKRPETSDWSG